MRTLLLHDRMSKGRHLFRIITLVGIVLSILASSIFTQEVYGYTAVKGSVKAGSAIVRTDASTSSDCAFCVKSGEEIIVLDEVIGKDSNTWYKVKVLDSTGYIRSDLVSKSNVKANVSDEPATVVEPKAATTVNTVSNENSSTETTKSNFTSQLGKVKGTGVNVRKEPVSGSIVTKVTAGDSITVVGSTKGSDGKDWYSISFVQNKNALNGYIRSDFVDGVTVSNEAESKQDTNGNAVAVSTVASTTENKTSSKTGVIRGTSVRIRDKEVSGAVVVQLNSGHAFTVLDEVKGIDNYTWYKIDFDYQGTHKEGFVRSDLAVVTGGTAVASAAATQSESVNQVPLADAAFEQVISAMPQSYKDKLRTLHAQYPNWKIEPVNTGLDWNTVVNAESAVGKNLTPNSSIASWKSTDPKAYNQTSGTWYGFAGGEWAAASSDIIKYYLDPRNFLDETGIFQFLTADYQEYQNDTNTAKILGGSFLSGSYTDTDGITRSYAGTFTEAGRDNSISPYQLAAMCLQEQGLYGTGDGVTGTARGYRNIFNYFNIGAYATTGVNPVTNGLIFASGTDADYKRPWNTRYSSIVGGTKYISDKYVKKGQNTQYFLKFNVVNSENGLYSNQLSDNISAASVASSKLKKAYSDLKNVNLVFRIPYYSNMPESPSAKPNSTSSPSNYLSTLSVDGYSLSPGFAGDVEQYTIEVDKSCSRVTINATPIDPLASVGGTGSVPIYSGSNVFYVVCKAQNGQTKTYTLTVVQK